MDTGVSDIYLRGLPTFLWQVFDRSPLLARLLQTARPLISPMEPMLEGIKDGISILDVGCGRGAFLLCAANAFDLAPSLGVDISEPAVVEARSARDRGSNLLGRDLPLQFAVCASIAEMPLGPFDVVCSIDVLHHVAPIEQKRFFTALAQRVRPGGTLIVKDMRHRPLIGNWWNRLHDLLVARQWISYVPSASVRGWASDAGLRQANFRTYRRFLYFHYLYLFRKPPATEGRLE